jgi:O-antigen/teichoic acid export membrane protein
VPAPAEWLCRAIQANQPGGYDQLGTFSAAITFQMPLIFLAGTIGTPLLSIISNAGENISAKLEAVNVLTSWIIAVLISIPILCFPEIMQFLLGRNFASYDFRVTLSLVVFSTALMACKWGATRVLAARGLLWWGVLDNVVWAVVLILSAVLLVDRLGVIGLATAYTLAYLVSAIAMLPCYYVLNVIPKGTFITVNAILLWLTLAGLVTLNILDASLPPRCIGFAASIVLFAFAFRRMLLEISQATT